MTFYTKELTLKINKSLVFWHSKFQYAKKFYYRRRTICCRNTVDRRRVCSKRINYIEYLKFGSDTCYFATLGLNGKKMNN